MRLLSGNEDEPWRSFSSPSEKFLFSLIPNVNLLYDSCQLKFS